MRERQYLPLLYGYSISSVTSAIRTMRSTKKSVALGIHWHIGYELFFCFRYPFTIRAASASAWSRLSSPSYSIIAARSSNSSTWSGVQPDRILVPSSDLFIRPGSRPTLPKQSTLLNIPRPHLFSDGNFENLSAQTTPLVFCCQHQSRAMHRPLYLLHR